MSRMFIGSQGPGIIDGLAVAICGTIVCLGEWLKSI